MSGPAGHIATSTSCKLPQWQNCVSGSWTGSYAESAVWSIILIIHIIPILPLPASPVMEAPHAQAGRVQQTVAVPRGGQGPESLTRACVGPPVESPSLLQTDEGRHLDQILLQEASEVLRVPGEVWQSEGELWSLHAAAH